MSNRYDALLKKAEARNALLTRQLKRIDALVKERNHLEVQIVKRDVVIARYQKWFKEHEQIATVIPQKFSTDAQFTETFHGILDSQQEES